MRSDFGIADLPFIVTVIGPDEGNPSFPYWTDVQASQAGMTGTNIAVVTAADLTAKVGDPAHLTTASLVTLGERYAAAINDLL